MRQTIWYALAVALIAAPASAQDLDIRRTNGFADIRVFGATSTGQAAKDDHEIEYDLIVGKLTVPGGGRSLRLTSKTMSVPVSLGGGIVPIADAQRTSEVIVKMRQLRKGATECRARVPAQFQTANKSLDIQLGDVSRFFDSEGRARAALCTAS